MMVIEMEEQAKSRGTVAWVEHDALKLFRNYCFCRCDIDEEKDDQRIQEKGKQEGASSRVD